jgi:lipopolysaccharide biosynthesis protein
VNLRTFAFYLPQFHPTALNDELWGAGFTEWFNVVKAKPLFNGHFQPKMPGELGFYDLRAPDVMKDQARIAKSHGVNAFCFYYYRFGSQRALHRPLDIFLENPDIAIDFLYCWANESWTKAWDGRSDSVLVEQVYDDNALNGLVDDLVKAMSDHRYVRIGSKPAFIIYQISQLPAAKEFVNALRKRVENRIGENITIGTVYNADYKSEFDSFIDFTVQFPPHRIPRPHGSRILMDAHDVAPYEAERGDYFESYEHVKAAALRPDQWLSNMYLGATPDWDNSARRPKEAHILVGSTPELFEDWVSKMGKVAIARCESGLVPEAIIFVNAWNEWAEGAMLEPSQIHGRQYLEALNRGLGSAKISI